MITPYLEQLIIEGKAQYKTFVAGYSQKHIMNIEQNRYIVITDLWYTPTLYFDPNLAYNPDPDKNVSIQQQFKDHMITQLTIFGDRGFNRFLFKNSISKDYLAPDPRKPLADLSFYSANNPIHISCYLIHTDGISFTFSRQNPILAVTNNIAPAQVPAYPEPSDYGKDGISPSLPVIDYVQQSFGYENQFFNANVPSGVPGNNEFSFPVNLYTDLPQGVKVDPISYPFVNVGYVEILGQPNNIGY